MLHALSFYNNLFVVYESEKHVGLMNKLIWTMEKFGTPMKQSKFPWFNHDKDKQ